MRYLELNCISKTNKLFQKLQDLNPLLSIEMEAYSCKSSRKQRNERLIPKPLRFLLSALELCFPDYDFHNESWESFRRRSMSEVRNEITYSITTTHKNSEDVKEFVDFLTIILEKSINLDGCDIYAYESRLGPFQDCSWHFSFLFFNKKRKRVVILNAFWNKN